MRYSEEEKRILVSLYYSGKTVYDVCQEHQISRSTFYTWVQAYRPVESKDSSRTITPKDFDSLLRRCEKQEQIIAVLKSIPAIADVTTQEKLAVLEPFYGQFSVHVLCEALDVPRGTFYNHIKRNKRDNSSYAEVCGDMGLESWLRCHVHAYSYFGGVTRLLIPDNLKTGVSRNTRYETILNRSYQELAEHYDTAIVPARVAHPKDKALTEGTVRYASTWILAALRDHRFSQCRRHRRQQRRSWRTERQAVPETGGDTPGSLSGGGAGFYAATSLHAL